MVMVTISAGETVTLDFLPWKLPLVHPPVTKWEAFEKVTNDLSKALFQGHIFITNINICSF